MCFVVYWLPCYVLSLFSVIFFHSLISVAHQPLQTLFSQRNCSWHIRPEDPFSFRKIMHAQSFESPRSTGNNRGVCGAQWCWGERYGGECRGTNHLYFQAPEVGMYYFVIFILNGTLMTKIKGLYI